MFYFDPPQKEFFFIEIGFLYWKKMYILNKMDLPLLHPLFPTVHGRSYGYVNEDFRYGGGGILTDDWIVLPLQKCDFLKK